MPLLLKVEIELFHIYVAKVATATSYVHHFAKSASYVYPSMCILIFLKGKSFANDPMVLIVIYYNTIDRVPEDFWCCTFCIMYSSANDLMVLTVMYIQS